MHKNLLTALALLAVAQPASAALLLQPGDGAVRYDGSTGGLDADGAFNGAYVFWDAPFFSTTVQAPTVSVNGFIRFGDGDGSGDYNLYPLNTIATTMIAPMWHDFQLGTSGQIIEHADPNFLFYGVTWNNVESESHPGYFATFQAIFFEENATIQGNDFLAGDIAFSYGDLGFYPVSDDAILGIHHNGDYATLDEMVPYAGTINQDMIGDFPVGADEYILFRRNGLGGYDVSIQPIPEPSTSLLAPVASLALLRRKRRA
jgi:hypothetical protein